ncbi:uncharacterized protein LOC132731087 [Ruditapes philippinarum]|uniref:uncharacterized protein LOC132731087 n=1 Tax=Ruditapes philippinarum TaxID=129788 RepID=UPI00295C170D|nr:uncharacterized protein LOC132731087 [Ruditapes philippinarum]
MKLTTLIAVGVLVAMFASVSWADSSSSEERDRYYEGYGRGYPSENIQQGGRYFGDRDLDRRHHFHRNPFREDRHYYNVHGGRPRYVNRDSSDSASIDWDEFLIALLNDLF